MGNNSCKESDTMPLRTASSFSVTKEITLIGEVPPEQLTPLHVTKDNCVIRAAQEDIFVHTPDHITRYKNVNSMIMTRTGDFYLLHEEGTPTSEDVTEESEDTMAEDMSRSNCTYREFRKALMSSENVYVCHNSLLLDSGSYKVKAYLKVCDMEVPCAMEIDENIAYGVGERRIYNVKGKDVTGILTISVKEIYHPFLTLTRASNDDNIGTNLTYYIHRKESIRSLREA